MKNVFDFDDYKTFLADFERYRKGFERGFRSKLAECIDCQSGYVTRVLNESAHFSLEQGLKIALYLKLNEREQSFFLLLIEKDRAGTKELKAYFKSKINKERDSYLNIKERVGDSRALTPSEQSVYYSNWHYLAVHMLTTIKGFDNKESISQALGISLMAASDVILFLLQTGILLEEKGKLKAGITQVHLDRESPLIGQHHTNWRIAAIQSLANNSKSDVHYSTVSTLSKVDVEKLKSKIVNLIEEYVATVKPSLEEEIYGFNLDFYNLAKR